MGPLFCSEASGQLQILMTKGEPCEHMLCSLLRSKLPDHQGRCGRKPANAG